MEPVVTIPLDLNALTDGMSTLGGPNNDNSTLAGPITNKRFCKPCQALFRFCLWDIRNHSRRCHVGAQDSNGRRLIGRSGYMHRNRTETETPMRDYCICVNDCDFRTSLPADYREDSNCSFCTFVLADAKRPTTLADESYVFLHPPTHWSRIFWITLNNREWISSRPFRVYELTTAVLNRRLFNDMSAIPAQLPVNNEADQEHKARLSSGASGNDASSNFFKVTCNAIRSIISHCEANHQHCRREGGRHSLPTRLVQLSGTPENPEARLVQVQVQAHENPDTYRYAALSYCWGGPQPLTTTKANIRDLGQTIDISAVSLTVRDAFRVALGIGLSYLWTDVLCIIQDGEQDKEAEIANMANIYAGATCTLSVVSASSSAEGIALVRESSRRKVFEIGEQHQQRPASAVFEYGRHDEVEDELAEGPLYQRAWTLQETILSPVLVSLYASGRLARVRCSTQVVRADGCTIWRVPPTLSYPVFPVGGYIERGKRSRFRSDLLSHLNIWHGIVTRYSALAMTDKRDKLSALGGIAAVVQGFNKFGTYWAGLWSKTLALDLLWYGWSGNDSGSRQVLRPAPIWVAPSWSWASRDHTVYYPREEHVVGKGVTIISCDTVPLSLPNANTNSTGALKSAVLKLRCQALSERAPESTGQEFSDPSSKSPFRTIKWDDDPALRVITPGEELWLLKLATTQIRHTIYWSGLVLQRVSTDSNDEEEQQYGSDEVFRRVGVFDGEPELQGDGSDEREFVGSVEREFVII